MFISPNTTAAGASSKMQDIAVSSIPVPDGELVGMITIRNLVRVMVTRRDPVVALVREIITSEILFC